MEIDRSTLGPNQLDWLVAQEQLRLTYHWLNEIDTIPDERELEILRECDVPQHGTSCFEEGHCISPRHPQCAKRKRI